MSDQATPNRPTVTIAPPTFDGIKVQWVHHPDPPAPRYMIRVIVTRDWLTHRWQVICPTCGGNDWIPTATHARWANAIDHATRHANGHRSYP